jgi:hypothetical protein
MVVVYEAENAIEAHMLRARLAQTGIAAEISGEYLLGALGDLPARDLVRLLVPEEDFAEARAVVADFEDDLAGG